MPTMPPARQPSPSRTLLSVPACPPSGVRPLLPLALLAGLLSADCTPVGGRSFSFMNFVSFSFPARPCLPQVAFLGVAVR